MRTLHALMPALQVLILAALVYALHSLWGLERLLAPWRNVPALLILGAIAAQAVSYSLRALRIYWAEPQIPRGAWHHCLRLVLINNALNLLLPARTGEVSFPVLMQRYFGLPLAAGTGTLLWLRLLDLNILLVLSAALLLPQQFGLGQTTPALAAGVLALAPLAVLAVRSRGIAALARREGRWTRWASEALSACPKQIREVLRDLCLTWAAWLIKLCVLGLVFATLAGVTVSAGVLAAIGGDLSTVLPLHTPGGFGSYEAGVLLFAGANQSSVAALLAAAVNLHLLLLGIALIAGTIAWMAPNPVRKSP